MKEYWTIHKYVETWKHTVEQPVGQRRNERDLRECLETSENKTQTIELEMQQKQYLEGNS